MYGTGSRHLSECHEFSDKQTGAHIFQLTDHPSINHNLYFLTSSFTRDQGQLIFTSYRSGEPNFFILGFPNGEIVQLTESDGIHGYSGIVFESQLFYTQDS